MAVNPTVGQIVHYRETPSDSCQAAIVVQPWEGDTVNLVLFRDGSNDNQQAGMGAELVAWKTSIQRQTRETPAERPSWHTAESLH